MLVVAKSTTLAFINEIIYIWLKRSDCEYKQAILGLRRAISSKLNMSSPTMSGVSREDLLSARKNSPKLKVHLRQTQTQWGTLMLVRHTQTQWGTLRKSLHLHLIMWRCSEFGNLLHLHLLMKSSMAFISAWRVLQHTYSHLSKIVAKF